MAKILFIQRSWFDLHGLMAISGLLKHNGHRCHLLIEPAEPDLITRVKEMSPDFVGFSIVSEERLWALEWATRIKRTVETTTVVGGIDATVFPQMIEHPAIDVVCRGEGEFALLDLLDRFDRSGVIDTEIPNLWFAEGGEVKKNPLRRLVEDLDTLPPVDRELYYGRYPFLRDYPIKRVMVGRGCPFACAYCCNRALRDIYRGKGRYVRRRSVDSVLEEITRVRMDHGLRMIDFSDDDFISDRAWLSLFLERYAKEIGLPFSCLVRIDRVDETIAAALARAGCTTVSFSVESGNETLRRNVLQKRLSDESIIRGASLLKARGLKLNTYNMLNIPGETLDDGFRTVELNAKIASESPWCSIFQPFPGTEFWDRLVAEHEAADPTRLTGALDFYSSSLVQQRDSAALMNLEKLFYYAVKFPSLRGVTRKLVRLPGNPAFQALFLVAFAYRHSRVSRMSLWEEIRFNSRHTRHYFGRGKAGPQR